MFVLLSFSCAYFYNIFQFNLLRHAEIEAEQKKEGKVRKLKKNLKLLMIALIVLAIEKLSEFITALISTQTSGDIEVKQIVV